MPCLSQWFCGFRAGRALSSVSMRGYMRKQALRLGELRDYVGLTQRELAEALGVSQPAISKRLAADDHLWSSLRELIGAMGGEMKVFACIDGEEIELELG